MQVKPLLPQAEHSPDSPPPSASPTVRFSFLAKILSSSQPKPIADCLPRPARFARTSGGEEVSVKSMLKKSIISEAGSQCAGERAQESFLMKGRTLAGTQKPLENHLNSFLLGIHQRISKEIEGAPRPESLPPLKEDWERGKAEEVGEKPRLSQSRLEEKQRQGYDEVFRNLKEMRASCPDPPESPGLPKTKVFLKYRQRSQMANKRASQTISYDAEQPSPKLDPPLPLLPLPRDAPFRKGYLSYDEPAKRFLQSCKSTMQLQCAPCPVGRDISARSFLVAHCGELRAVAGRRAEEQVEIASLSKIMTCYLTIMVCRKYGVDPHLHAVRVGDRAPETPGTTAELQTGDVLTVYDLLMGLMLPSGNDASVVLAEAMGKLIQRHKKRETRKTHYETFIAHMNLLSKELGLSQVWGNSSGLPACPNLSSPADMVVLTAVALKSPLFHRVVNTKTHEIDLRNERYGLSRHVVWRNTNRLLESGWEGVKTGTTETAGHCLMAKRGDLLVCVLDCDTLSRRFTECEKLYERFAQP